MGDNLIPVVLSSVAAVLFLIISLSLLIVFVKNKLMPSGDVTVIINGDTENPLVTEPGTNLLSALSNHKLFLPSACGGGGTCAMCKCQVMSGGGEVLPTEMNFLTRREANEHWRLACQVKIRENMDIKVPDEIFGIKKWECEVISNHNVATFIKEFIVRLPEGEEMHFEAGGYVQIYVPPLEVDFSKDIDVEPEYRPDWDEFKIWDLKLKTDEEIFRAYSMANYPAEGNIVMLNIRIATPPWDREKNAFMDVPPGICSSYIFSRKPGDKVTVAGPYGEFFIKPTEREMCFIGGGAGMAPLRSQVMDQLLTHKTKRKITYWYGGRSLRELFYTEDFRTLEKDHPHFTYHIALSEPMPEDNWTGPVGFIHSVVLNEYLLKHEEPEEIEYYLCGPPMMLSAVMKMLDDLGVPPENIAFDDFGS